MSQWGDLLLKVTTSAFGNILFARIGLPPGSIESLLGEAAVGSLPDVAQQLLKRPSDRRRLRRLPTEIAELVTDDLIDSGASLDEDATVWMELVAANIVAKSGEDPEYLISLATNHDFRRTELKELTEKLTPGGPYYLWIDQYLDRVSLAAQSLPAYTPSALANILNSTDDIQILIGTVRQDIQGLKSQLIDAEKDSLETILAFQRRSIHAASSRSRLLGLGSEGIIASLPIDETYVKLEFRKDPV